MPLVTGGGNDPVSLADDVERRGISGTGAPTTEMYSQVSTTELMYIASYQLCRHYIIHNLTSRGRFRQQRTGSNTKNTHIAI